MTWTPARRGTLETTRRRAQSGLLSAGDAAHGSRMSAMWGRAGVKERGWKATSTLVNRFMHWASVYTATISEHFLHTRNCVESFSHLTWYILPANLCGRRNHEPHRTGKDTEAQSGCDSPASYSPLMRALGFSLRPSHTGSRALTHQATPHKLWTAESSCGLKKNYN